MLIDQTEGLRSLIRVSIFVSLCLFYKTWASADELICAPVLNVAIQELNKQLQEATQGPILDGKMGSPVKMIDNPSVAATLAGTSPRSAPVIQMIVHLAGRINLREWRPIPLSEIDRRYGEKPSSHLTLTIVGLWKNRSRERFLIMKPSSLSAVKSSLAADGSDVLIKQMVKYRGQPDVLRKKFPEVLTGTGVQTIVDLLRNEVAEYRIAFPDLPERSRFSFPETKKWGHQISHSIETTFSPNRFLMLLDEYGALPFISPKREMRLHDRQEFFDHSAAEIMHDQFVRKWIYTLPPEYFQHVRNHVKHFRLFLDQLKHSNDLQVRRFYLRMNEILLEDFAAKMDAALGANIENGAFPTLWSVSPRSYLGFLLSQTMGAFSSQSVHLMQAFEKIFVSFTDPSFVQSLSPNQIQEKIQIYQTTHFKGARNESHK